MSDTVRHAMQLIGTPKNHRIATFCDVQFVENDTLVGNIPVTTCPDCLNNLGKLRGRLVKRDVKARKAELGLP